MSGDLISARSPAISASPTPRIFLFLASLRLHKHRKPSNTFMHVLAGLLSAEALRRASSLSSQSLGLGAFCMREWVPASNENAHSPDSCNRSTYGSPKRAALDLPSWSVGFYSAGTPGQLRDSTPGKHGRADDRLVCRQSRVMALLRLDGDGWFRDRRFRHLPACSQGREGNARTQVPGQEAREGLQNIQAMGLWGHRHRRLAATAGAHGSISLCRGRHAILREKISLRTNARQDYPILPPRVPGSPLRTASAHGHLATWASGPHCGYRADYGGNGGSHFHSHK